MPVLVRRWMVSVSCQSRPSLYRALTRCLPSSILPGVTTSATTSASTPAELPMLPDRGWPVCKSRTTYSVTDARADLRLVLLLR